MSTPTPDHCSECGERSQVYDSRARGDYVWRRRECPEGHRWTTYEVRSGSTVPMDTVKINRCASMARGIQGLLEELRSELAQDSRRGSS